MMDIQPILDDLKKNLLSSKKEKILGIATTADQNNPPFILGSMRETKTTIAGTLILRDASFIDEIVNNFDGVVDYFFVDCELKNELHNLESIISEKVKKSKIFVYKPNDFTVDSLDMFVATLFSSLQNRKALIIGAGNIGSKIALKLCERGANVFLFDKDPEKTRKIIVGLNLIKRSKSSVKLAEDILIGAKDADLVVGCTPGIPVINAGVVEVMNTDGKIIDAGNRTVLPEALTSVRTRGIEVLSLSSLGGYTGMIENFLFQRKIFEKTRMKNFGDFSLVTSGTLGRRGDILVDDIENPSRIYGVCDGLGTLLPKDEGLSMIKNFVAKTPEISNIEKLYN